MAGVGAAASDGMLVQAGAMAVAGDTLDTDGDIRVMAGDTQDMVGDTQDMVGVTLDMVGDTLDMVGVTLDMDTQVGVAVITVADTLLITQREEAAIIQEATAVLKAEDEVAMQTETILRVDEAPMRKITIQEILLAVVLEAEELLLHHKMVQHQNIIHQEEVVQQEILEILLERLIEDIVQTQIVTELIQGLPEEQQQQTEQLLERLLIIQLADLHHQQQEEVQVLYTNNLQLQAGQVLEITEVHHLLEARLTHLVEALAQVPDQVDLCLDHLAAVEAQAVQDLQVEEEDDNQDN